MLAAADSRLIARRSHWLTNRRLIFLFATLIGQDIFVHEEVDPTSRVQMPINRVVFISAALQVADLMSRLLLARVLQNVILAILTAIWRLLTN